MWQSHSCHATLDNFSCHPQKNRRNLRPKKVDSRNSDMGGTLTTDMESELFLKTYPGSPKVGARQRFRGRSKVNVLLKSLLEKTKWPLPSTDLYPELVVLGTRLSNKWSLTRRIKGTPIRSNEPTRHSAGNHYPTNRLGPCWT